MSDHRVFPPRFVNPAVAVVFAIFSTLSFAFFSSVWIDDSCASELRETAVVKAVRRAAPSVVNIRGEKRVGASGAAVEDDMGRRVNGMGTGVVIDPRGYIITNHHVVDGVREIQVTLDKGERYIASLVSRDSETDLAVIKIDCPRELQVVELGTSADLMTGEPVIAVGNAFGYEHTVTRGIISSLHRAVQVSDAQYYSDLIQTDASINPGNSGGALLNIDGQMIGIVVAVRAGAQGIGFAIPIDKAIEVATNMLAARNEAQTKLGMKVATAAGRAAEGQIREAKKVVESASDENNFRQCSSAAGALRDRGVVVASVEENSPAAAAGIKPGDIIKSVDGRQIQLALDFQKALLEKAAGQEITIDCERDGSPLEVAFKLAAAETAKVSGDASWEVLGLQLERIDPERFRNEYKTRYRGGLIVTSVRPGSPAAGQGIHAGDVLVGMHIWETVSLDNVAYILKRPEISEKEPIKFFILRGNETLFGYMSLAMRSTPKR